MKLESCCMCSQILHICDLRKKPHNKICIEILLLRSLNGENWPIL